MGLRVKFIKCIGTPRLCNYNILDIIIYDVMFVSTHYNPGGGGHNRPNIEDCLMPMLFVLCFLVFAFYKILNFFYQTSYIFIQSRNLSN